MKTQYRYDRLELLPENEQEARFCKALMNRITDSNIIMAYHGDVKFDGKETCGFIITPYPDRDNVDFGNSNQPSQGGDHEDQAG